MSVAAVTSGGIALRPGKNVSAVKVKETYHCIVSVQGPELRWYKPPTTGTSYTTGQVNGSAAATNFAYTTAVRSDPNPFALNTHSSTGDAVPGTRDIWGFCVNRLPHPFVGNAHRDNLTTAEQTATTIGMNWVNGAQHYRRYRVMKCEITFRPIQSHNDNMSAALFGVNRVHNSYNDNYNRPIAKNKTPAVKAAGSHGTPFTLHDAKNYKASTRDQCVGGGWVKFGDPKEPRVQPFKVTWDRMTWFYNSGRFPEHWQEPAYNTTINLYDGAESGGAGTNNIMGREDVELIGLAVDKPVFYEPYIIPVSALDTGAGYDAEWWWRMGYDLKYYVEFSDPYNLEQHLGQFAPSTASQKTLWNGNMSCYPDTQNYLSTSTKVFSSLGSMAGTDTRWPDYVGDQGGVSY